MSNPYVRGMSKVRPAAHLRSAKKFNPARVENAILASQLICHGEKHCCGKLVYSAPHTRLQKQINISFLVFNFLPSSHRKIPVFAPYTELSFFSHCGFRGLNEPYAILLGPIWTPLLYAKTSQVAVRQSFLALLFRFLFSSASGGILKTQVVKKLPPSQFT